MSNNLNADLFKCIWNYFSKITICKKDRIMRLFLRRGLPLQILLPLFHNP